MGTRRGEAVLTSTHNLCFGAKIRKIGIPPHIPVFLYKSGGFILHGHVFLMTRKGNVNQYDKIFSRHKSILHYHIFTLSVLDCQ